MYKEKLLVGGKSKYTKMYSLIGSCELKKNVDTIGVMRRCKS
jgi:hypothetical protein